MNPTSQKNEIQIDIVRKKLEMDEVSRWLEQYRKLSRGRSPNKAGQLLVNECSQGATAGGKRQALIPAPPEGSLRRAWELVRDTVWDEREEITALPRGLETSGGAVRYAGMTAMGVGQSLMRARSGFGADLAGYRADEARDERGRLTTGNKTFERGSNAASSQRSNQINKEEVTGLKVPGTRLQGMRGVGAKVLGAIVPAAGAGSTARPATTQPTTQPATQPAAPINSAVVNWGMGPIVSPNGTIGDGTDFGQWDIKSSNLPATCKTLNIIQDMTFYSHSWNPRIRYKDDITTPRIDDGTFRSSDKSPHAPYFCDLDSKVNPDGTATVSYYDQPYAKDGGTYSFTFYIVCNDAGPNHGTVVGAYKYEFIYPQWGAAKISTGNGPITPIPALPAQVHP